MSTWETSGQGGILVLVPFIGSIAGWIVSAKIISKSTNATYLQSITW
jgi:hypothetical protein